MKLAQHLLLEEEEIVAPGMGMGGPLFDPPPELLNVVQPRRIGGQRQDVDTRFCGQSRADFGVEVDRPVVGDQVYLVGLRVEGTYLFPALGQPVRRHAWEVPDLHLSTHGVQHTYDTHQGVGAVAVAHPRLAAPQACPQPSLAGLAVEAGLVSKQHPHLSRTGTGLVEGLNQPPLFSSYSGSGLWRCG